MTEPTKRCTMCGRVLPLSEFHLDRTKRDGHFTRCKECRAEYRRKHYTGHREEIAERHRKYRLEHREEIAARRRQHRQEHLEEFREYDRQYKAQHRGEIAETRRRNYVPRRVKAQAPAPNPNAEMCARLDAAIRARQGADA